MTFDLWPDFRGHVRRNLRSVPFQRLKLVNFGMFAGDIFLRICIFLHEVPTTLEQKKNDYFNEKWFFEFWPPKRFVGA